MNPGGMQESCNLSHRICKYKNFLRSYRVRAYSVLSLFSIFKTPQLPSMQALVPLVKWHSVGPLFYLARRIRVSALSWILFLLWNGNRLHLVTTILPALARIQSCGAQCCGYPSNPLLQYPIAPVPQCPVPRRGTWWLAFMR